MKQYTSWVEVDKSAIKHNLFEVKNKLKPTRVLAVVKANAYGHGSVEVARLLLAEGIDYLGVALAEEAIILRDNGIEAPILILGPVMSEALPKLIELNCTLTISNVKQIDDINQEAIKINKKANIHLNINTGMNRYGINPSDVPNFLIRIKKAKNVNLEGVYTHFPQAENESITKRQFALFTREVDKIKSFIDYDLIMHCANSIAAVKYKEMHLDMIRIGSLLFGQSRVQSNLNLKKSWQLKSKIINIIDVNKGEGIGYDKEFTAEKDMKVAIVPLGFHHGVSMWPNHTSVSLKTAVKNIVKEILKFSRASRAIESALVGTREANYVGKTGMEHLALDITDLEDVKIGDVVDLRIIQTAVNQIIPIVYKEGGQ